MSEMRQGPARLPLPARIAIVPAAALLLAAPLGGAAPAAPRWRAMQTPLCPGPEPAPATSRDIRQPPALAEPAGARVFAYASVIDNSTGDPTVVPLVVR